MKQDICPKCGYIGKLGACQGMHHPGGAQCLESQLVTLQAKYNLAVEVTKRSYAEINRLNGALKEAAIYASRGDDCDYCPADRVACDEWDCGKAPCNDTIEQVQLCWIQCWYALAKTRHEQQREPIAPNCHASVDGCGDHPHDECSGGCPGHRAEIRPARRRR